MQKKILSNATINAEVHNNTCILKQILEKENVFKSKRTYAEALTKDKLLGKKIPKLIVQRKKNVNKGGGQNNELDIKIYIAHYINQLTPERLF